MSEALFLPTIADGEDKTSPLKNRIRKNYRHIRKWAKRTQTTAFRIYDREIDQYPLAIDYYEGRFCFHYFSKSRESEDPPQKLYEEAVSAICSIFNTNSEAIYWRTRIKREKREQYEKVASLKEFFTVLEYGVKFKVNLIDYLDTGLFLDHRETRRLVASMAKGKRVLNLFAYTSSFSVHAALAGAIYTKSVDMSNTYNAWSQDNFILNGLPLGPHPIVRADCLKFLDEELKTKARYDLIILDPPTLSRSKMMSQMLDIQLDYISLITKSLKLLTKEGTLFFSTNSRKFVFDESLFQLWDIIEISKKTMPIDFHDEKIHRCWKISHRGEKSF